MTDAKGANAVAVTVTISSIAFVIVSIRLWIRFFLVRAPGWDDLIITAACAAIVVLTASIVQQVRWGLGAHTTDVNHDNKKHLFFYFWMSVIAYNFGLGLIKISIVMQYLRIFATTKAMRMVIMATLTFIGAFTLESTLVGVFSCNPVNKFWHYTHPGTCVNFKAVWFSNAAINIFSDVLIISLPMPIIKGLNIPPKQKIALMGIFALGIFGSVTSILRLKSLYGISDSNDVTFDNADAAVWSNIEINVAIICASLPSFKALIKRLFPRLLSTNQTPGSASNKHTNAANAWRSRVTRQDGTLISMDRMERGDAEWRSPEGLCTTTIQKGADGYPRSDADSVLIDDGIKVVTVVSQREDSNSDKQAYGDDGHSLSESERKFFPNQQER